jgi:hypothetical protein
MLSKAIGALLNALKRASSRLFLAQTMCDDNNLRGIDEFEAEREFDMLLVELFNEPSNNKIRNAIREQLETSSASAGFDIALEAIMHPSVGWLDHRFDRMRFGRANYLWENYGLELPDAVEIAKLPKKIRVSLAARCARYASQIAALHIQNRFHDRVATLFDDVLTEADIFAGDPANEEISDLPTERQMLVDFISKSTRLQAVSALARNDLVESLELGATSLAARAVNFVINSQKSDNGSRAHLAIVYGAAAYCQFEEARLELSRISVDSRNSHRERLGKEISEVFLTELDIASSFESVSADVEKYGRLKLDVEYDSSDMVWRDAPVFVSSTFADMHLERDYLRNDVIPRLARALQPHRIRPMLVDLRWSVSERIDSAEMEREVGILTYCFREIDRCHPVFLGLIGNRWGWKVPTDVAKHIVRGTNISPKNQSATSLEFLYAIHKGATTFFYSRRANHENVDGNLRINGGHDASDDSHLIASLKESIELESSSSIPIYENVEDLGNQVFEDLLLVLPHVTYTAARGPDNSLIDETDRTTYCKSFLELHNSPATDRVVEPLLKRSLDSKWSGWLDATLDILSQLDALDVEEASTTSDTWEERIEKYALNIIQDASLEQKPFLEDLLKRCAKRIEDQEFLHTTLMLLVCSSEPLGESDFAAIHSEIANRVWQPLQFAKIRFYLGSQLVFELNAGWRIASAEFIDIIRSTCSVSFSEQEANRALGRHFSTLPRADGRRLTCIDYLIKGRCVAETASLLGAYEAVPIMPDMFEIIVSQPSDFQPKLLIDGAEIIVDAIIQSESKRENEVASWLCEVISYPLTEHVSRHRLCHRAFELVKYWLQSKISARTCRAILFSCTESLASLELVAPEEPVGQDILAVKSWGELRSDDITSTRSAILIGPRQEDLIAYNAVDSEEAESRRWCRAIVVDLKEAVNKLYVHLD